MNSQIFKFALTASALMTIFACGDDTTETEFNATSADQQFVDATCAAIFRCEQGGDSGSLRYFFESEARCNTYYQALANEQKIFDKEQASINEGRVRFDAEKFQACIAHMKTNCRHDEFFCEEAFIGLVAKGGACFSNNDCDTETVCTSTTDADACSGTCQPRRAGDIRLMAGDEADIDEPCGNNVGGKIVACAPGGKCSGAICEAVFAEGEACHGEKTCESGLTCHEDVCTKLEATLANEGDACSPAKQCNIRDRLFCDSATMTCKKFDGDGGVGSNCSSKDLAAFVTCKPGLICLDSNQMCAKPKANGENCNADEECLSDDCDGVCKPRCDLSLESI